MPDAKKKKKKKAKAPTTANTQFKNRGGSKFTLKINDNKLHDILKEELNLFGTSEMAGITKPQNVIDTYRAVLYFMWGVPLDTPVDKDFVKKAKKAIARMKKEDPMLFEAQEKAR